MGLFVSSFGLIQVLICIFFGIPTAKKLTRQGIFVSPNPIVQQHVLSATVLLLIFVGISFAVYSFAPNTIFTGYVIGVVLALIFGLGQIGGNKNNMSDFLEQNKRYVNKESLH